MTVLPISAARRSACRRRPLPLRWPVALIGLPPSSSHLPRNAPLGGALALGQWYWVLVIGSGSLLAGAYVFRILGHAFGTGAYPESAVNVAREEWPALLLGITATVLLGLGSGWLWPLLGGVA